MIFTHKIQYVIHGASKQIICNGIQPKSPQIYSHRLFQHLNREGEEAELQKQIIRTVMIRVSGLIHKRAKKVTPGSSGACFTISIACIMISRTNER